MYTQRRNKRRQAKLIFWFLCWQAATPKFLPELGFLPIIFQFPLFCLSEVEKLFQRLQSLVLGEIQYGEQNPAQLVAEEKISFGINAVCSSFSTIQDIKSAYNEVDGRLVAKEVSCSPYFSFVWFTCATFVTFLHSPYLQ